MKEGRKLQNKKLLPIHCYNKLSYDMTYQELYRQHLLAQP